MRRLVINLVLAIAAFIIQSCVFPQINNGCLVNFLGYGSDEPIRKKKTQRDIDCCVQ